MATKVLRKEFITLTSAASAVQSPWFRLGGNDWDVQFVGPADLYEMQGSNDKLNTFVVNDIGGTPITAGVAGTNRVALDRPEWVRVQIAIDASQPREFNTIIAVQKRAV